MWMTKVSGKENLYVGGVAPLRSAAKMKERNITHILSCIQYSLNKWGDSAKDFAHLCIDLSDIPEENILKHFPRMVRFIDQAFYGSHQSDSQAPLGTTTSDSGATSASQPTRGGVYVHCAMGISRSVSAVLAYLLWKYPHRFNQRARPNQTNEGYPDGLSDVFEDMMEELNGDRKTSPAAMAVQSALRWVRDTRSQAGPNSGFIDQLELWWDMGCPADSDGAVERHPIYQRWIYTREVARSAKMGKVPNWIRFEDEEMEKQQALDQLASNAGGDDEKKSSPPDKSGTRQADAWSKTDEEGGPDKAKEAKEESAYGDRNKAEEQEKDEAEPAREIRCGKCRRVLATKPFILAPRTGNSTTAAGLRVGEHADCPHIFIEPLSWMRPILDKGELDGRITCPNDRCNKSVGRYSWHGFKCSCSVWVCPAFSLHRSKVDDVISLVGKGLHSSADRAALGIVIVQPRVE